MQRQKMRPTYRPKHERRINENRGTRPRSNYTSGTRGKRPSIVRFDELPTRRFKMPPQGKEPSNAKMFAQAAALVLGGLAVLYAITWIYGHFRWGW